MGWGSWLKVLGGIGGAAAAPFTGGTSLAWLPGVLGAAGVAGGALESRGSTGLRGELVSRATDKLNSPTALPEGYESTGISNINSIHDLIGQSLQNKLTQRGLGGSPNESSVLAKSELARGGDISRFSNSIPLLELDYQNRDMNSAANVLGAAGNGSTSNVGSGIMSAVEMLAELYGSGAFGGGKKKTTAVPQYDPAWG